MADCPEPVLLIAFNRPDLLAGVIEQVRLVRPPRVYLAVDGPRPDRPQEREQVRALPGLGRHARLGLRRSTRCSASATSAAARASPARSRGSSSTRSAASSSRTTSTPTRPSSASRPSCSSGTRTTSGCSPSRAPTSCRRSTSAAVGPTGSRACPWCGGGPRGGAPGSGTTSTSPAGRSGCRCGGPGMPWAAGPGRCVFWSANFDMMARHAIDTWDLQLVFASMADGALHGDAQRQPRGERRLPRRRHAHAREPRSTCARSRASPCRPSPRP